MEAAIVLKFAAECASAARAAAPLLARVRDRLLSGIEKDMLRAAAANEGELYVLTAEQIPKAVIRAGGKHFGNPEDARSCVEATEAFEKLCRAGYVAREEGNLFRLTSDGFKRADSLGIDIEHEELP